MTPQPKRSRTRRQQRGLIVLAVLATVAGCGLCGGILQAVDGDSTRDGGDRLTTVETVTPRPSPVWTQVSAPAGSSERVEEPVVEPTRVPRRTREPEPEPADTEDPDVYYGNCADVRAAGAAPIHRGDPGYSRDLDRDGDGTACE